jgi:signal transduction histidine kinase
MRTKVLAAVGMAAVGVQLILVGRERDAVHAAGPAHRAGVRPGRGHLRRRGSRMATSRSRGRSRRGGSGVGVLPAVKLIAGRLTVPLDNAQLYAELIESRARIVAAADQTCRRIERDLHDGAQQRLANLVLQARMAREAAPETGELAARLDAVAEEATRAMAELRDLARGVHPAVLAEGGLRPALRGLARRSAVPVALEVRVEGRLPEQVETAAYFAVAEALTNAAKHANATAVTVAVEVHDRVLRVRVSDDGRGGADPGAGSGLVGLKDRVEALGGRFSVQTAPDAGTTVHAELPLRRPADEAGLLDWSPAASSARGGRRLVRGRCCPVGGDAVGDVASVLVEEAE